MAMRQEVFEYGVLRRHTREKQEFGGDPGGLFHPCWRVFMGMRDHDFAFTAALNRAVFERGAAVIPRKQQGR